MYHYSRPEQLIWKASLVSPLPPPLTVTNFHIFQVWRNETNSTWDVVTYGVSSSLDIDINFNIDFVVGVDFDCGTTFLISSFLNLSSESSLELRPWCSNFYCKWMYIANVLLTVLLFLPVHSAECSRSPPSGLKRYIYSLDVVKITNATVKCLSL